MISKIEIRVYKVFTSGNYELRVTDVIGIPDLTLSLNAGSLYNTALRDAERLAVAINCDLYVDDELTRKRIGEGKED